LETPPGGDVPGDLKAGTYTLIAHSGDAMCIPLNVAVQRAKRLDARVLCSVR